MHVVCSSAKPKSWYLMPAISCKSLLHKSLLHISSSLQEKKNNSLILFFGCADLQMIP